MAQSFTDFITEEEQQTKQKYKLLVVSTRPKNNEYYHTTKRLLDEAKSAGIEAFPLLCETARIDSVNNQVWNSENSDKKFDIDPDNTVAIIRGSVARKDAYLDLVSQLEKMGVSVVNSRTTVSICADKYRSAIRLNDSGVPTPKTSLLQSVDTVQDSLDSVGEEYPLILKTLRGSKGIGVIFIESRRQLDSIIQLLWKQDADT